MRHVRLFAQSLFNNTFDTFILILKTILYTTFIQDDLKVTTTNLSNYKPSESLNKVEFYLQSPSFLFISTCSKNNKNKKFV